MPSTGDPEAITIVENQKLICRAVEYKFLNPIPESADASPTPPPATTNPSVVPDTAEPYPITSHLPYPLKSVPKSSLYFEISNSIEKGSLRNKFSLKRWELISFFIFDGAEYNDRKRYRYRLIVAVEATVYMVYPITLIEFDFLSEILEIKNLLKSTTHGMIVTPLMLMPLQITPHSARGPVFPPFLLEGQVGCSRELSNRNLSPRNPGLRQQFLLAQAVTQAIWTMKFHRRTPNKNLQFWNLKMDHQFLILNLSLLSLFHNVNLKTRRFPTTLL
ncbi:hypothetical protein RND71_024593 [Anisodus tanguticus]|uniref:Uncharacterized protein n=1 Tax=Anisodus tanguticus TaxID=243964 RepID=A0AAE1RRH9_9SOLA|nr:hypothetical protein RND71_024593 [Anisodus tanguticus]